MALFVVSMIILIIAVGFILGGVGLKSVGGIIGGVAGIVLAGVILFFGTWWQNGEGEAKVLVHGVDRTVVGTITEPGAGFKPAWVDFVEFDTFNQEATYAGEPGSAPEYSGGTVNGSEITMSVGGVSGGSTQGYMDVTIVYVLGDESITDIYREFRSQERFTRTIIEKQILSTARQVPAGYSATEFRGPLRAQAELEIQTKLNERLGAYGVEVISVTIQDVRYPAEVEEALKGVEVANQKQQTAEAELRAAEVSAQQKVVEAQAEAEANRVLSESLSPQILEQRRIDALLQAAKNNNLIITDGTSSDVLISR